MVLYLVAPKGASYMYYVENTLFPIINHSFLFLSAMFEASGRAPVDDLGMKRRILRCEIESV